MTLYLIWLRKKSIARIRLFAKLAEEGQRDQSADPHQTVNNPAEQGAFAKQELYQVKFKSTDQTPVNSADDNQKQSDSVDYFHIIDPPAR